jgi:hypothetical protein
MKLLLAVTFSVLLGCAPQHSGDSGVNVDASTLPVTAQSLQSFQTTVYAFGHIQGCAKCHSYNVNPQWANNDLLSAYSVARPLLNVTDPNNSIFATYVANNHCSDPICADPANIPIMQDYLAQWANVEQSQTAGGLPSTVGLALGSPPYVTATMPIPTPLPVITSGTAPAIVRFNLSALSPAVAALSGAILEISIQAYHSSSTTYKVFNPRLVGAATAVTLSNIHVYVRPASGSGLGTEDVNQGLNWAGLTVTPAVIAAPSPLPAGPMTTVAPMTATSVGIGIQSGADVITIGFAGIQ